MRVLIVTAVITAVIGGLCVGGGLVAITRGALEGSGEIVSEQRSVSGFSAVSLDGPGRLVVTQGEAEGLSITTDDNILETIETGIDGETLEISFEREGLTTLSRIHPTEEILFELTVQDLDAIDVNGTADVELDGFQGDRLALTINGLGDGFLQGIQLDELVVDVNGSSTFDVAGAVDRQEVDIDGAGAYRAANLASREAVVEIDGDGEAVVRVSETLDVTVNGSGLVEYIGSPQVTEDISGNGEVRPLGVDDAGATPVASPAATPRANSTPAGAPTPRSLNVLDSLFGSDETPES